METEMGATKERGVHIIKNRGEKYTSAPLNGGRNHRGGGSRRMEKKRKKYARKKALQHKITKHTENKRNPKKEKKSHQLGNECKTGSFF